MHRSRHGPLFFASTTAFGAGANAGFDGIHYAARHDPQFTERSVAVFGAAGDQSANETAKRFEVADAPIDDGLVRGMVEEFSITVLPFEPLADE